MKMADQSIFIKERLDAYTHRVERHANTFFKQGFKSIYDHVVKNNKKRNKLLLEFQHALRNISQWTADVKIHERTRFHEECPEAILNKLFELKTYVIKGAKIVCNFSSEDFVYECYLNIARELWKNPYIMYDIGLSVIEKQEKRRQLEKLIKRCFGMTLLDFVNRIEDDSLVIDKIVDVPQISDELVEGSNEEHVNNEVNVEDGDDDEDCEDCEDDDEDCEDCEDDDEDCEDCTDDDEDCEDDDEDCEDDDEDCEDDDEDCTDDDEDDDEDCEDCTDDDTDDAEGIDDGDDDVSSSESSSSESSSSSSDKPQKHIEEDNIRRIQIPQHMSLLEKKKMIKEKMRLGKKVSHRENDSFF
jgi:hypothetical protein